MKGEIFANVWTTDCIARIDPATGRVLGWIDLRGLLPPRERDGDDVLNGIAYDAPAIACSSPASSGRSCSRSRSRGAASPRTSSNPCASQKIRAVGTGHHRSCTFPMMYFFGTMPQWRLSELLFRWSPITK